MEFDEKYIAEIVEAVCQKPRPAGSQWNATVRKILIDRYRLLGFDVSVQESKFTGWELDEWPRVDYLAPINKTISDCLPVVWSGSIDDGPIDGTVMSGVEGILPKIKTFEAYEWSCFPVIDHKGILRAVLLSNERDDRLVWPQPRDNDLDHLPYILIGTADGIFIQQCLQANIPVNVRISVKSHFLPNQKLNNVFAQQSMNPSIIVGAHYDSFFHTQGAHDNASGTACLLYLARFLAESPIPNVQLASFDAEEWNKLGAYRYVETLSKDNEISKVKRMINIDSVGIGDKIQLRVSPKHLESLTKAVIKSGFLIEPGKSGFSIDPEDVVESKQRFYGSLDNRPKVSILALDKFPQFDSWPFMKTDLPVVQVGATGNKPFLYWHDPRDIWQLIGTNGYHLIAATAELVYGLLQNWK